MTDCENTPNSYQGAMTDISQSIHELRTRLGMNQAEFAALIGVTQATVSKWEAGTQVPKGAALIRISEAAGTNLIASAKKQRSPTTAGKKEIIEVSVSGYLQASIRRTGPLWSESNPYQISVPLPPDMGSVFANAYEIRGDFLDAIYQDGAIVVFDSQGNYSDLVSGDVVHVETKYKDGLQEDCAWLLQISGRQVFIRSNSRNPDVFERHCINIGSDSDPDVVSRKIVGVAIISVNFDRYPVLPRRYRILHA